MLTTACSANAHGTVNFANSTTSLIAYVPGFNGGSPVPVGQFTVGLLYWAADPGEVNFVSGSLLATTLRTSANFVSPGRFIGGVATTPATTPGNGTAWFAVVAWQTSFGSYEATRAGGGYYGYTSVFQNPTGYPDANPPGPPAPLSGFLGINTIYLIPEPSVIALAALGCGAILLGRHKAANQ